MTYDDYLAQRTVILADMAGKVKREDWHGVQDCGSDLRDLDNFYEGYKLGFLDGSKDRAS